MTGESLDTLEIDKLDSPSTKVYSIPGRKYKKRSLKTYSSRSEIMNPSRGHKNNNKIRNNSHRLAFVLQEKMEKENFSRKKFRADQKCNCTENF